MNIGIDVNVVNISAERRVAERDRARRRAARPAGRRGYHHGDLREALVAGAVDLIAAFGPRGFSMSQACRAAAVSPAALYRHFAGKEALLAEVARRGFVALAAALAAAAAGRAGAAGDGPADRLVRLGRAYVRFAVDHPALFRAMFGAGVDKPAFPDLAAAAAAAESALAGEVGRAKAAGAIAGDPGTAAAALWAAAHGVAMLRVEAVDLPRPAGDRDAAAVFRVVVAGLGHPDPRPA